MQLSLERTLKWSPGTSVTFILVQCVTGTIFLLVPVD